MLKKALFKGLLYFCYAIILMHSSIPHCHAQDKAAQQLSIITTAHTHDCHLEDWLLHLFDHHNETISGEEDVFEYLPGNAAPLPLFFVVDILPDFWLHIPFVAFSHISTIHVLGLANKSAVPDDEPPLCRHRIFSESRSLRAPPVLV